MIYLTVEPEEEAKEQSMGKQVINESSKKIKGAFKGKLGIEPDKSTYRHPRLTGINFGSGRVESKFHV